MRFMALLVASVGMSVSVSANAFPGMEIVRAQARSAQQKSHKTTGACTDFSGAWQGQCVDDAGDVYSDQTTIAQYGCDSISFENDLTYDIGGINGTYDTSPYFTSSNNNSTDWDATRTGLQIKGSIGGRSLGGGDQIVETGTSAGKLAMLGNQLVTSLSYQFVVSVKGDNHTDGGSLECVYDKVQKK